MMTFADDQERHHCALDLDRAREAKPQVYALAQWALLWADRLRADLLGDERAAVEAELNELLAADSTIESLNSKLRDAIDLALEKLDAGDEAAAIAILEGVLE